MPSEPTETGQLVERLRAGDRQALTDLFQHYRDRLHRMVELRMDTRIQGRVDASDVLQDAFLDAAARLDGYLRRRTCRRSSGCGWSWPSGWRSTTAATSGPRCATSARRSRSTAIRLPQASSAALASMLLGRLTSPSEAAVRAEMVLRVQEALNALDPLDREMVALRHFEQLSRAETAQILGITEEAGAKRYIRALVAAQGDPGDEAGRPARFLDPCRSTTRRTTTCSTGSPSEFAARLRKGERPAVRGVCRATPRAGRRDPRAVPGAGHRRAGRGDLSRTASEARGAGPGAVAGRRLPDRPRDRPRGHGGRLRGRAGLARPPRGPEGPALAGGPGPHDAGAVPPRGPRLGPAAPHQHRAGLRGGPGGRRPATTRCSSSRARAWTRSSTSCGGYGADPCGSAAGGRPRSDTRRPAPDDSGTRGLAGNLGVAGSLLTGRFDPGPDGVAGQRRGPDRLEQTGPGRDRPPRPTRTPRP